MAQLLIKKGADATAANEYRWTSLYFASRSGHEGVVGLLIDKGAHPSAGLKDGRTPLHLALADGHEGVV